MQFYEVANLCYPYVWPCFIFAATLNCKTITGVRYLYCIVTSSSEIRVSNIFNRLVLERSEFLYLLLILVNYFMELLIVAVEGF